MQYTWLKDKNGTDIFESDIVRIHNHKEDWKHGEPDFDWRVFEVQWNKCTFCYNNDAIYMVFSDYNNRTLEPYDIEVIGNIYQTPDLIK
jgi:uncharacterized phage protein (TIGR01671 family)